MFIGYFVRGHTVVFAGVHIGVAVVVLQQQAATARATALGHAADIIQAAMLVIAVAVYVCVCDTFSIFRSPMANSAQISLFSAANV